MPAYTTHTLFSHLALLALAESKHPLAGIAQKHAPLFRVAGIAGADIQCMPYQICTACEAPYRHDQKENKRCLVCGEEKLEDFTFITRHRRVLKRKEIERQYYGNTHLVLYQSYRGYGVKPDEIRKAYSSEHPFPQQVVQHLANCLRDAAKIPRHQQDSYLAFILGWFSHVVSDALFKGVYPDAVRLKFFGHQYHMSMLPAAETLTYTDIAYDFGVNWPSWHKELLNLQPDGGALVHLAMGDEADAYDPTYWTGKFGKPDPRIGDALRAVPPINRKWFHRMYTQPDYSAATPLLDSVSVEHRASARFGPEKFDLGQVRRYAISTGWYQVFIKGTEIYVAAVKEAAKLAEIPQRGADFKWADGVPSLDLWSRVVTDAKASSPDWGSKVFIDEGCDTWLRRKGGKVVLGKNATDYQKKLARILSSKMGKPEFGRGKIIIGAPAFNPAASDALCHEETLRLKYDAGLAALVRTHKKDLLMIGFSDFGDQKLIEWAS